MKKYLIIILLAFFSQQLFSQNEAIYTRRDSAVLLKPTVFNTARFLSFRSGTFLLDHGMEQDVPALSYTFSLAKNTVIQISQTVYYTTSHCVLCPEAGFDVMVYINNEKFAFYHYTGSDKLQSVSGSALAQLGPGTYTIKIRAGIGYTNAGDVTIIGSSKDYPSNCTHMSLLFFPEE